MSLSFIFLIYKGLEIFNNANSWWRILIIKSKRVNSSQPLSRLPVARSCLQFPLFKSDPNNRVFSPLTSPGTAAPSHLGETVSLSTTPSAGICSLQSSLEPYPLQLKAAPVFSAYSSHTKARWKREIVKYKECIVFMAIWMKRKIISCQQIYGNFLHGQP